MTNKPITRQNTLDYLALAVDKVQEVYDFLKDPEYELGYLAALDTLFYLSKPIAQHVVEHCHQHAVYIVHDICVEAVQWQTSIED